MFERRRYRRKPSATAAQDSAAPAASIAIRAGVRVSAARSEVSDRRAVVIAHHTLDHGYIPARPVASQAIPDGLPAHQGGIEVAGRPAHNQRVESRIDVVRPGLEGPYVQAGRTGRPAGPGSGSSCRSRRGSAHHERGSLIALCPSRAWTPF
jgi:hypothetical protein